MESRLENTRNIKTTISHCTRCDHRRSDGWSVSQAVSVLQVGRSTVDAMAKRYREQGEAGLVDRREDNGNKKLYDDDLTQFRDVVAGSRSARISSFLVDKRKQSRFRILPYAEEPGFALGPLRPLADAMSIQEEVFSRLIRLPIAVPGSDWHNPALGIGALLHPTPSVLVAGVVTKKVSLHIARQLQNIKRP
ncbi:MAG: helix-turn-helix domain-containing protein [Planctomycetaceae bacterium]|jgi:hypothetical protein